MRKLKGRFSESECSLLRLFRFRHLDPLRERWAEINRYNAAIMDQLPEGAKGFVVSDWHYNANDPRCPHDSWIQSIDLGTHIPIAESRHVQLRLLGAYHDRTIRFDYSDVTDCSIQGQLLEASRRNLDWLYDEVHVCDSETIEHLIDFEACVIRIECVDFTCTQILLQAGVP
jgi:hypothetical protein